jgi:DNA-directed RNA polymerase II subunit RPB1
MSTETARFSSVPLCAQPPAFSIIPYIEKKNGPGFNPVSILYKNTSSSQLPRTIMAPDMGPMIHPSQKCSYCKNTMDSGYCMYHPGKIDLIGNYKIKPMFYGATLDFVNNHICVNCFTYSEREIKVCEYCKKETSKIEPDINLFYLKLGNGTSIPVSSIYKAISDISTQKTGFNYNLADVLMQKSIHVIPPNIRPKGKKTRNYTNEIYDDIVECKNRLANVTKQEDKIKLLDIISALDWMLTCKEATDLEIKKKLGEFGKSYSTIQVETSVKGTCMDKKEALLRRDILSTKTSGMIRAVIECEVGLAIDTLGIPAAIAADTHRTQDVNQFNQRKFIGLLNNWPNYPTIVGIMKLGSKEFTKIVDNTAKSVTISIGDKVQVHLLEGDYVHFNRAPSLWYYSITPFKVEVYGREKGYYSGFDNGDYVFKINNQICKPFNADFDGDAMSAIMTNSPLCDMEMMFNTFEYRLKSMQSGVFNINPVEDTIMGLALATRNNEVVDIRNVMFLLSKVPNALNIHVPKELVTEITTRRALSLWLPSNLNLKMTSGIVNKNFEEHLNDMGKGYPDDHRNVIIENGIIKSGIIEKAVSSKILAQNMSINDSFKTMKLLESMQQYALAYLEQNAFTLGVGDLYIHPKFVEQLRVITESAKARVGQFVIDALNDVYDIPINISKLDWIKETVIKMLTSMDEFETILKAINIHTNAFTLLSSTGSKGEFNNLKIMFLRAGYEKPVGKMNYTHDRVSVFCGKNEITANSLCFVFNCLTQGLSVYDYPHYSMKAREGILDKSFSAVAQSGAEYRIIVKNMEPYVSFNNKTFNLHNGKLHELFSWGEGFRTDFLEKNNIPNLNKKEQDIFEDLYKSLPVYNGLFSRLIELKKTYLDYAIIDALYHGNEKIKSDFDLPFGLDGIISKYVLSKDDGVSAESRRIANVNNLMSFLDSFPNVFRSIKREVANIAIPAYYYKAVEHMSLVILSHCTNNLLSRMNTADFKKVLDEILYRVRMAIIPNGFAIGIYTAMIIAEPTTQLALNSIHAKDKSNLSKGGLQRIREVLHILSPEKLNAPITRMILKEGITSKEAEEFRKKISLITFEHYIKNNQVEKFDLISSQFNRKLEVVHKNYIDENPCLNEISTKIGNNLTLILPHALRIVLNKEKIIQDGKNILDIVSVFKKSDFFFALRDVTLTSSTKNPNDYVIWLIPKQNPKKKNVKDLINQQVNILENIIRRTAISGYKHITFARLSKTKVHVYNEEDKVYKESERYQIETNGSNLNMIKNIDMYPEIDSKYTFFDGPSINAIMFGSVFGMYSADIELGKIFSIVNPKIYAQVNNTINNSIILKPISRTLKTPSVLHNMASSTPFVHLTNNCCSGQQYARTQSEALIRCSRTCYGSDTTSISVDFNKLMDVFGITNV